MVGIQLVKVRPVLYRIHVEVMQRLVLVVHTHIPSMHSCVIVISLKDVTRRDKLRMQGNPWMEALFGPVFFTKLLNDHSSCLVTLKHLTFVIESIPKE